MSDLSHSTTAKNFKKSREFAIGFLYGMVQIIGSDGEPHYAIRDRIDLINSHMCNGGYMDYKMLENDMFEGMYDTISTFTFNKEKYLVIEVDEMWFVYIHINKELNKLIYFEREGDEKITDKEEIASIIRENADK